MIVFDLVKYENIANPAQLKRHKVFTHKQTDGAWFCQRCPKSVFFSKSTYENHLKDKHRFFYLVKYEKRNFHAGNVPENLQLVTIFKTISTQCTKIDWIMVANTVGKSLYQQQGSFTILNKLILLKLLVKFAIKILPTLPNWKGTKYLHTNKQMEHGFVNDVLKVYSFQNPHMRII